MVLIFIRWNILYRIVLALAALLFYNEFLIYYITMLKCQWPSLSRGLDINRDVRDGFLKVMVLSDVHLLGSREGHWFDKIRRLLCNELFKSCNHPSELYNSSFNECKNVD